jgi:hypothetical protein
VAGEVICGTLPRCPAIYGYVVGAREPGSRGRASLLPKRRENRGRRYDHRHRYHDRVRHRGVPPVAHLELARHVTASPACSRRRKSECRVRHHLILWFRGRASGIETARQKDAAGHPYPVSAPAMRCPASYCAWWPRCHDHPPPAHSRTRLGAVRFLTDRFRERYDFWVGKPGAGRGPARHLFSFWG